MGAAAVPIAMVAGSAISGIAGNKAADKAASAQKDAAKTAAKAAEFRPYNITTGFGSSAFDTKNNTASYSVDPRLAAFRDLLYGGAADVYTQLGGYDPQQFAQEWYNQQQGLLQPSRAAEDINRRDSLFASGRGGLFVSPEMLGAGTNQGYINPETYAAMLARSQVDANIANQAFDRGQSYMDSLIGRAGGLFSTGTGIEQLGQYPLELGANIGAQAAVAGGNMGSSLLQGGLAAANTRAAAGANNANMLGGAAEGLFKGLASYWQQPSMNAVMPNYYTGGSAGNTWTSGYDLQ